MRIAPPSGKTVLAVGAVALTLVVVATSGAVAGALITSKDIENDTIRSRDIKDDTIRTRDIRAGAVTWGKSFDQATRDLIEGLVENGAAGAPGPQGPPGPAGPAGPSGSSGSNGVDGVDGVDGDGTLAGWSLYDLYDDASETLVIANPLQDPENPEDDVVEVPLDRYEPDAGPLALEAGSYLVTLRSLSATLGLWVPQISSAEGLSGPTPSMGVCLSLFLPCETTFPVVVPAGGADLELYLGDIGAICGCETADPQASLSVVSLGTGAGVTAPEAVPELGDVVDGLVTQILSLIGALGLGDEGGGDEGFRRSMRQLQRHYVG